MAWQLRIFGVANDICSGKGVLWKPREVRQISLQEQFTRSRGTIIRKPRRYCASDECSHEDDILVADEDGEWLGYKGFWGKITNPVDQVWFKNSEDPNTWGWFRRAFYPCAPRPPVIYK